MLNYIGTFNKPTAISKSISCSFLEPYPNLNVVIAKNNYLEIYKVNEEILELIISHNIFGKIIILEKIVENKSLKTDNIFILNESLDYCILTYDKLKADLNIIGKGSIRENMYKIKEEVHYCVDKNYKFILVSPHKNIYKVVFLQVSEREKNQDFKINKNYDDVFCLFNLNRNFSLKDISYFLEENNNENNDFSFDFKNMEKKLNTNSYGYRNLSGIGNKQVFQVIKQNQSIKEEKKTSISYHNNMKFFSAIKTNSNTNFFSELFAMVKLNNTYINNSGNSEILSSNDAGDKQIITLEPFLIDFQNKEIKKLFKNSFELENFKESNFIFSPKIGGFLIFYSDDVEYFELLSNKIQKCSSIIKNYCIKTPFPKFEDYGIIDLYNYLLYDKEGEIYLFNINLIIKQNNNDYNLKNNQNEYEFYLIPIGSLNYVSSICYLEKNRFFIGSNKSNSYYIKINNIYSKEYINNLSDSNSNNFSYNNFIQNNNFSLLQSDVIRNNKNNKKILKEPNDYFEILEEYESLAPISNFVVLNDSNNDESFMDINTEILCICGTGKYTSLKSIRKGFKSSRKGISCIQEAEIPFILGESFLSVEVALGLKNNYFNNEYNSLKTDNNNKLIQHNKNINIENHNYCKNLNNSCEMIIEDNESFNNSNSHYKYINSEETLTTTQILMFIW